MPSARDPALPASRVRNNLLLRYLSLGENFLLSENSVFVGLLSQPSDVFPSRSVAYIMARTGEFYIHKQQKNRINDDYSPKPCLAIASRSRPLQHL